MPEKIILQRYVKKVDFCPDLHEICGCHDDGENDGRTIGHA